MKYNIILAYVLAASSFSIGCVGSQGMMDKWREREAQLASCHQELSQYSVININRSPRHPWGRLVHLSGLIKWGGSQYRQLQHQAEGMQRRILSDAVGSNNSLLFWERGWYIPSSELTAQQRPTPPLMGIRLWPTHHVSVQVSVARTFKNKFSGSHRHRPCCFSSERGRAFAENPQWTLF